MTPHHRGYDQPSAHAEATPTRRLRLVLAPRAVTATVWAARLAGLLTLASVISPLLRRRVRPESWFDLPAATSLAASVVLAAAGSGLMLLAIGLRRRKRRAWQLGAALCVLIIVSHAVGRHPLVPLVVAAVLLVGLVITRREFTALPDPVDRLVALRVVVQLLAAGFLIVTLLLLLVRPALLEGRPSVGERLAQAALSLIGVSGPVAFRAPWLDDLTAGIGLTFGVGALVLGGYFLLRSAEPRPALTPTTSTASAGSSPSTAARTRWGTSRCAVTVICVEFAQPAPVNRVEDTVAALGRHGYTAIARSARPFNWKMTFRRR